MWRRKEVNYIIKDKAMAYDFSEGQIEAYKISLGDVSYIEALLYLWLYNNFSTNPKQVSTDNGRPMYRRLAKTLTRIIEEQADE